jgi:hypothetical protein
MNSELLLRVIQDRLMELVKKETIPNVNIESILVDKEESIEKNDTKVAVMENEESIQIIPADKVEKKLSSITINNNTQNIKTINNISMDIGSRRKRILEIVKSRGAVTINEFIDSIKGCSSKTIQRELTSLVLSGTLKKTGERRWSKYSLK